MKLTVKNFGPIRKAKDIEISPMTIFVGPSNSGKSYLAMLVYSIFEVFSGEDYAWNVSRHFMKQRSINVDVHKYPNKPEPVSSAEIKTRFSEWAKITSELWKHKLVYCFGEEGKNVIEGKNGSEGFSVKIADSENQFVLDLAVPSNSKITSEKSNKLSEEINLRIELLLSDGVKEGAEEFISSEIYLDIEYRYYPETILESFVRALLPFVPVEMSVNAYYLPAIRGGIMQSHRALVSALIEGAPMAGLRDSPDIPLFNGVLSDFMKNLIYIGTDGFKGGRSKMRGLRYEHGDSFSEERECIEQISKSIEQDILSGEIHAQTLQTRYPDFVYKFTQGDAKYDLPLMSASSSVSELAPVSLFIRHYVCPGDLFILEEPEAHLHPGAQRDISGVLTQLVNAGVNVLITTHSDNILEQISNYIYAAGVPDDKITKLDKEKCSVYLFEQGTGSKQTMVKKVPFDPETGLLTQDHLDVSSSLYNETVNLMEQRQHVGNQTDIS